MERLLPVRAQFPQPLWWDGPDDHPERDWFFKYVRATVAPGALMAEFRRFLATDVRAVLPFVRVPALVLVDPSGEGDTDPRNGRFAASRIPGAKLAEVPIREVSPGITGTAGRAGSSTRSGRS
jgi:hypothetical protein